MDNYKAVIAYEGRRYKGFKKVKSDEGKTIQGKLESILSRMFDQDIEVISGVNTAPGVDAKEQVINFKVPSNGKNSNDIFDYLEEYLPDDIITLSVEKVDEQFHSRYKLEEITYTYRLWKADAATRPLFERNQVKVMDQELDVEVMKDACQDLLGSHDFRAFTNNRKVKSSIKTITQAKVEENDFEVIITLSADGFLLNMERYIVGSLIEVGIHQKDATTISKAFTTLNEKHVGHKTMAGALCLTKLKY